MWRIALVGGWLLCAAGCAGAPTGSGAGLVFPEDAADAAAAGTLRLIDVRLPRERTDPRIAAGAVAIPFDPNDPAPFVAAVERLVDGSKAAPMALICEIGVRSAQARRALAAAGFTDAGSVDQGYGGWRTAGLPLHPAAP
ncbi:rhodanese-like domain-containing protein [Neoroseomonas rubea]|uniref:rhodanese-like domain-containing protein n=1 Tax=Neoroseomonas rubea TaxID=2748666 RepID=UPI0018DF36B0|nr:rhodanese-like domain-containing protein [Roseomonas rubea]